MPDASALLSFLRGDRIHWMGVLIVLCFVSVLLLRSQSAASYPTYALSLLMLATFPHWRDVLGIGLMQLIAALLVWLSLSTIWSEPFEWREAVSVWSRALLVFFFVVAMAECQLRGQVQKWMGVALTVVGAIVVLVAIGNFYISDPVDGRLNGLGQLDTHVVAALVYGAILILVVRTAFSTSYRVARVASFAVAAIIAFAIIMSDSRNAWVSVLLGVAAYVLALRCADWRQFLVSAAALGLFALIALIALASNDLTTHLVLPRGDSFRFAIWGETLSRISADDALLFGRGILTNDDVIAGGIVHPHPHNIYLALLHQGGLVALGLYMWVLVAAFLALFRNFESGDAKLGLAVLTMAVFAHLLDGHELVDKVGDTWFLVWMPIGLALGLVWTPMGGRVP